jgi:hypothetical protein
VARVHVIRKKTTIKVKCKRIGILLILVTCIDKVDHFKLHKQENFYEIKNSMLQHSIYVVRLS